MTTKKMGGKVNCSIPGPVCPIDKLKWGNSEDSFGCTKWGQTMTFPQGNTIINRVMIKFEETINYQEVYQNIDIWFKRFYQIYQIMNFKKIKNKENETPPLIKGFGFKNTGLILYSLDIETNKSEVIRDTNSKCFISLDFANGELTYEIFEKIVCLVNKQRDLNFSYKCYLEGIIAFFDNDFKKAITICSPALENALHMGLEEFSKEKHIYFLNKLIDKKYKMLGGYFDLAKDLNMNLPTQDYKTKILLLRNKVIHKGYEPTQKEVKDYLEDIKVYLDYFIKSILE